LGLLLWLAACAATPATQPPSTAWTETARAEALHLTSRLTALPPAAADAVAVHLAFPAVADLDLYVTDPRQETAYYGNSPTRTGGTLLADRRCTDPPPRIESIHFEAARPGRYRVGVDFPQVCASAAGPVPFAVLIEHGGQRETQVGLIQPLVFLPIVLEFDVP